LSRSDVVHGSSVPLCAALRGRRIRQVRRQGKQVRVALDAGRSLVFHLGMTGRLIVVDRDEPVEAHTHLGLTFQGWRRELRFSDPRRFGGVWLVEEGASRGGAWLGRRLPPVSADPLTISLDDFRGALRRRRQIKALLLDQRPISGVGNIYCDEALHRAGIHPLTRAIELDAAAVARLWRALRRVLAEAIRAGGSSISDYRSADNQLGNFQLRHRVYGRAGKPCRKCGTSIRHLLAAGRSTFICSRCQPGPPRCHHG
jgi:formamidopyrimidine-DNA glycosylase